MTAITRSVASDASGSVDRTARRVRAVLLDAGNTLFYEKPSRFDIYAGAARDLGLAAGADDVRRAMHAEHERLPWVEGETVRYTDRWFRAYVPAVFRSLGAPAARAERLVDELRERFRVSARFHLFPETAEVLDALRAGGARLAIVSNWSERLASRLEEMDLARRVDAVLISAVEGVEKPSPAIFERAVARLGVDLDDAIHVGDHPVKDVEGARAAGLRAWLIDRDGGAPEREGMPTIRSLRELVPMIGDAA